MRYLLVILLALPAWGAYTRAVPITLGAPSSTLTNFPVLLTVTADDFKLVANGGSVTSSSGYDIVFVTSNDGFGTKLAHEIVSWNGTTGAVTVWVKVPSLAAAGTTIYAFVGNSAVTTDQSDKATVWSGYRTALHMDDSAATTAIVDSSGGYTWALNTSTTSARTTTGKVGAGLSLSPSYWAATTTTLFPASGAWSASFWVNMADTSGYRYMIGVTSAVGGFGLRVGADGKLQALVDYTAVKGESTGTLPTRAWAHVYVSYSGTIPNSWCFYINGTASGCVDYNAATFTSVNTQLTRTGTGDLPSTAAYDEFRVMNSAASAAWATAEYANQNAPATWSTFGTWTSGSYSFGGTPPEPPSTLFSNAITIHEASGSTQASRPTTQLMFFARGEFPSGVYPKPRLNWETVPATWQTDVKSTWPDGSVMTAFVSFPVSLGASSYAMVDFVPDSNPCHLGNLATCQAAALDQSGMTGFLSGAWDAQIVGTANSITNTVSAKTMIGAGAWRYILRGPVVTRVIAEDMTTALAYDFGWEWSGSAWITPSSATYKPVHPWFEATFYAGWAGVEVDAVVENPWVTKFQRQVFDLSVKTGSTPTTVYSSTAYPLRARQAAHYVGWSGTATGAIVVDRNLPYLVHSRLLPPYETNLTYPEASMSGWNITTNLADDNQNRKDPNNCTAPATDSAAYCGIWERRMGNSGGRQEIAFTPGIYMAALFSFQDPAHSVATKIAAYNNMLRQADIAATEPLHYRESDTTYRSSGAYGERYYFLSSADGTPAFGRMLSLNARPTGHVGEDETEGTQAAQDKIVPTCASGQPCESVKNGSYYNWLIDSGNHMGSQFAIPYLLSGRHYYLATLQQSVSYLLGAANHQMDGNGFRADSLGIRYDPGASIRGPAWSLRETMLAYMLSPDGVERSYFAEKIKNNDAAYEGLFNITAGNYYTGGSCNPTGFVETSSVSASGITAEMFDFGINRYAQSTTTPPTFTVNGSAKTVGILGVDSGKDYYYTPGGTYFLADAATPMLAAPYSVAIGYSRYTTPASAWCHGRGVLAGGLPNGIGILSPMGDLDSAVYGWSSALASSHGWQQNYMGLVFGWFRQTKALAAPVSTAFDFAGARYGRFAAELVMHPDSVMYAAGWYNWPMRGPEVLDTWAKWSAKFGWTAGTLMNSVNSTDLTIGIQQVGPQRVPGLVSAAPSLYYDIDGERMLGCAIAHETPTAGQATITLCVGGRGQLGTAAASHTAGATISTANQGWKEVMAGHSYPNIHLSVLAVNDDISTDYGSGLRAYTMLRNSGYGHSGRGNEPEWAFAPRVEPRSVTVTGGTGTATLTYTSPTLAACRYAVATAMTDSSDADDTSDSGGSPSRSVTVSSLTAGTYQYRITCGTGRAIGSVVVQ